jgi:hypothetical protein
MTAVDDTIDILSDSSTMDDNNPSSIDMTSKVSNIICEAYDIPIDVMKVVCPTLVVPKPERASRSNHSQHAPKCSNMAEGNSQSCETSTDVFIKVEDKIDYKLDGDTKCMCYAKTVESENMVCLPLLICELANNLIAHLMVQIQCHKCSDWSHEVCYGYWDKTISTLGQTTHLCFGCKKADGEIFPLIDHSHFSELCIFRRALHLLSNNGWHRSIFKVASTLGSSVCK